MNAERERARLRGKKKRNCSVASLMKEPRPDASFYSIPKITHFATNFLDDDPDRLMTTEELFQIQGKMEEFVNEMMKYQIM